MEIKTHHLQKHYHLRDKTVEVFNDFDITISSGDFVAITGASGVGKSTLLHILGTLDMPTGGQLFYDNIDVSRYSSSQLAQFRNHTMGFVFQFHHLLPEFSALENCLLAAKVGRLPAAASLQRAHFLLEQVGLFDRMHHRPGELSGGEQQRVALARALMNHPRVLFADEPTGNLDDKTGEGIFGLLHRVHEEEKMTVVLVTHHLALAKRAKRHVHLEKLEGKTLIRDIE